MGDLPESVESHIETLKMIMATQQHLEATVDRIQVNKRKEVKFLQRGIRVFGWVGGAL